MPYRTTITFSQKPPDHVIEAIADIAFEHDPDVDVEGEEAMTADEVRRFLGADRDARC